MRQDVISSIEENLGEVLEDNGFGNVFRTASGLRIFIKSGPVSDRYRCEANGLAELSRAGCIGVARVISVGDSHIATEYIEAGMPSENFFNDFGRNLARMHRHTAPTFGFYEDNFIGTNSQPNRPTAENQRDWALFYLERRLLFQYLLAERNGHTTAGLRTSFRKLEDRIAVILEGSKEPPTLLHGDLWAGNFLCDKNDKAVLIDPAVYYGHREADMAMTRMFGGFPETFYRAYQKENPLKEGWEYREPLYRLYHVLNHLNMVGAGYRAEAEKILDFYMK